MNNNSLWTKRTAIKRHAPLFEDISCEALVIGGGLSGLLTAYFLTQSSVDTVLVDASQVASGQTKNTTAKITALQGVRYDKLIKMFSQDTAQAYAHASLDAIDEYEKIICSLKTDCGFSRLPSYLYTKNDEDLIYREFKALTSCQVGAVLTDKTELPFDIKLALRLDNQAQFDPLAFVNEISSSLRIYENTRIIKVEKNTAVTPHAEINAKNIVFATHYPFVNFPGYYFPRMHQSRSYVLALENAQKLSATYYSADENGLSFRADGDYLLLGSKGRRTGDKRSGGSYEQLEKRAKLLYPKSKVIARFAAQDCMTIDSMPLVGRYSRSRPSWYAITGFEKWGMTNAMISAKLVCDLICKRENKMQQVLSPRRFAPRSTKKLMSELSHSISGLSKSAFYFPSKGADELANGQGKIVIYKSKKAAVYKTEQGKIHALSPRCTHLGCQLEFNSDEKTWDCPCHGSRFSYTGKLLDNPAQKDLEKR